MVNMKLINRGTEGEVLMEGRLDSAAAPEAEKLLNSLTGRFDRLVLNMETLQYISSAGLRILKVLHVAMKKKGGSFAVKNVNSMVMEVLEMTGIAGLIEII